VELNQLEKDEDTYMVSRELAQALEQNEGTNYNDPTDCSDTNNDDNMINWEITRIIIPNPKPNNTFFFFFFRTQ
jgi:predicted transcriptional regulator